MSLQGLKQKKTLQPHHTGSDLLAREGRRLMKATSQTPTVLGYGLRHPLSWDMVSDTHCPRIWSKAVVSLCLQRPGLESYYVTEEHLQLDLYPVQKKIYT